MANSNGLRRNFAIFPNGPGGRPITDGVGQSLRTPRMIDPELLARIEEQDKKLELIKQSVDKIRRYLFWTFVAGAVTFILPLIGLAIVIPYYLNTLGSLQAGW